MSDYSMVSIQLNYDIPAQGYDICGQRPYGFTNALDRRITSTDLSKAFFLAVEGAKLEPHHKKIAVS